MNILGIETSCDETAAAVVQDGRRVLAASLYSQIEIHREYGGVVPEIASRAHAEKLPVLVPPVIEQAGGLDAIDVIAVTEGPGLVGALLAGISYAKALAWASGKPLVGVDHIAGHIGGVFLSHPDLRPPFICLVVSGGHTEIVFVKDYRHYEVLGRTRDDAAGEAIDKAARLLGYPYPGGPNLQDAAFEGDPDAFFFPRSFRGEDHLDFSFSGPKTAVRNLLQKMEQSGEPFRKQDVAASFLSAVTGALVENTLEAAKRTGTRDIALAGGVSANCQLREAFEKKAEESDLSLYLPKMEYCTDNAAMIAAAGYYAYLQWGASGMDLNADPGADLGRYTRSY